MDNWSEDDLKRLGFKEIRRDVWATDSRTGHKRKVTKSQPNVRRDAERSDRKEAEIERGVRYRLEFTAYRTRLLDWFNLAAGFKIYEDMLVKYGVIPDDCPALLERPEINQIKIGPGEIERTVIKVYRIEKS